MCIVIVYITTTITLIVSYSKNCLSISLSECVYYFAIGLQTACIAS